MAQGRLAAAGTCLASAIFLYFSSPGLQNADAASVQLRWGVDYPGNDIGLYRGVSLDYCQQLCVGNAVCQAFTYNRRNRWCFLKHRAGYVDPIGHAVSGLVYR